MREELSAEELDIAALIRDAESGGAVAGGADYAAAFADKSHVFAKRS